MKAAEMNIITGAKAIDAVKKYTENVIIRMSKLYPDCVGGQEYCLLSKIAYAEMLKYNNYPPLFSFRRYGIIITEANTNL